MIKDINFDIVGNLIAELRNKNGVSQQDFASDLGVSKGAVSQWEQGSGIKTENLYDIAKYFNITVSELLEGKLAEEEDENYFERNYTLDPFEEFSDINESNYENVLEYLKRCKNVIKRFMFLFQKRKEDSLTKKQQIEYRRLFYYFELDFEYARAIGLDIETSSLDDVIKELTNIYEINDSSELDYMLYKLYHLHLRIDPMSLLNYDADDTAVIEYLELIGKEGKDVLLTQLVSGKNEDEIESSLAIKRLIESGDKCFFTRERILHFEYNQLDEDFFKQLSGINENKIIQDRRDFFKQEENTNRILERYNPYSWKNYTKDGYDYLIDSEKTDWIRNVVLLKNDNPKAFYNNLVAQDAKHLGGK